MNTKELIGWIIRYAKFACSEEGFLEMIDQVRQDVSGWWAGPSSISASGIQDGAHSLLANFEADQGAYNERNFPRLLFCFDITAEEVCGYAGNPQLQIGDEPERGIVVRSKSEAPIEVGRLALAAMVPTIFETTDKIEIRNPFSFLLRATDNDFFGFSRRNVTWDGLITFNDSPVGCLNDESTLDPTRIIAEELLATRQGGACERDMEMPHPVANWLRHTPWFRIGAGATNPIEEEGRCWRADDIASLADTIKQLLLLDVNDYE